MANRNKEDVKNLCKTLVSRLENNKAISFAPRLRHVIQDEVFALIGPYIVTEEHLREQAIQKIGASHQAIEESQLTESAAYKTAKTMIRAQLGDDELNGFIFVKTPKHLAEMIASYLMRSASIDEVYETDEDLVKIVLDWFKGFNPSHVH